MGPHGEESLAYLAVESGIHRLSDGITLEAGTVEELGIVSNNDVFGQNQVLSVV